MFILMTATSAILFFLVSRFNDFLFYNPDFEFAIGVGWIYLPAGMRLLNTLLFGGAGAVGILLSSLYVSLFTYFPDDPIRAIAGSIAASLAPYLTYLFAQKAYGLKTSLVNLNAKRLFLLTVLFSVTGPTILSLWLFLIGRELGMDSFVMMIGDFVGSMILIYGFKLVLSFFPVKAPPQ